MIETVCFYLMKNKPCSYLHNLLHHFSLHIYHYLTIFFLLFVNIHLVLAHLLFSINSGFSLINAVPHLGWRRIFLRCNTTIHRRSYTNITKASWDIKLLTLMLILTGPQFLSTIMLTAFLGLTRNTFIHCQLFSH